jgi:hypothetical protein
MNAPMDSGRLQMGVDGSFEAHQLPMPREIVDAFS